MTSDEAEGYSLTRHLATTKLHPLTSYTSLRSELNTATRLERAQVHRGAEDSEEEQQDYIDIDLDNDEIEVGNHEQEEEVMVTHEEEQDCTGKVQQDCTENEQKDITMGEQDCSKDKETTQQKDNTNEDKGEKEKSESVRAKIAKEMKKLTRTGEKEKPEKVKEEKAKSKNVKAKLTKEMKKIAKAKLTRKEKSAEWYRFLGDKTASGTEIPYLAYLQGFVYNSRMIQLRCGASRWSRWSRWSLAYATTMLWTALTATCAYMVAHWAAAAAAQDLHDFVRDATWLEATSLCPKRMYRAVKDHEQEQDQDQEQDQEQGLVSPLPGLFLLMHIGFQTCTILGMIVFHTYNSRAQDRMMAELVNILPSQDPIIKGASRRTDLEAGIERAANNFRE